MRPGRLVPLEVSRPKVDREIERWKERENEYRARGWLLLRRDDLVVEIAFAAAVQMGTSPAPLPVLSACIRLDYSNYDLWPPSLTFIDLFSGEPAQPHVRAPLDGRPPDLLVDAHPKTRLPFMCVQGTREYHEHPQHDGDSWLMYRSQQLGSLATVCDRVWRAMARNVFGFRVTTQTLPPPVQPQAFVQLWQGDVDALQAQVAQAAAAAGLIREVGEDAAG